MKLFIFKILAICIMSIAIFSCAEDDQIKGLDSDTLVVVAELNYYPEIDLDGRLLFNDMAHFESFMKEFEDLSLEQLQEINNKKGFVSSYQKRVEKEESLGYELTTEIIEDKKFASILSASNEIAFKDGQIYQGNHDFCFIYKTGYKSLIDQFRDDILTGSYVVDTEVPHTYKDNLQLIRTIQDTKSITLKDSDDRDFESGHRLQGATKRNGYFIYWYVRALSHAKKKKWFWWTGEDISLVRVSGSAVLTYNLPFGPANVNFTFDESRFNDDKVTETLDSGFGQGTSVPTVVGTATHRGRRNGVTRSFTTSW